MTKGTDRDEALKRLGGGRWQTRDERFTIEPQSGTWVVVDAEQTDDLGLALVRGPFGTLRDAKVAIEIARGTEPAESPLSGRIEQARRRPAAPASKATKPAEPGKPAGPTKPNEPDKPAEPRWLTALEPDERRRARRLLQRLVDAEASDPEGMARRDIVDDVPTAAAYAIVRAIVALGRDASPGQVSRLLADGRDEDLGVRWRLVDEDGRSILLDLGALDGRNRARGSS